MKKYWFAVALALAQPTVHAEEKSDPLDAFRVQTQFQTLMCRMETHAAILQVQLGKLDDAVPPMRICIKKAKADLKKIYPAALKVVAKKPPQKNYSKITTPRRSRHSKVSLQIRAKRNRAMLTPLYTSIQENLGITVHVKNCLKFEQFTAES
ncbi:MAG: hypothetical protein ACOH2S_12160 [Janthinobacterium svalbardensis]|uniref:Uncharacterized protein n=1 Tax=Janthinobacterium svalbardensis TaxID=368607 RepID=A0A290WYM0_9BURK|nr:hypothetical protein [Janthinobacterium svalbardensis]ATD61974.1 hypothetical protein CNX70_18775 [Janthinobacterium svalbardensis]